MGHRMGRDGRNSGRASGPPVFAPTRPADHRDTADSGRIWRIYMEDGLHARRSGIVQAEQGGRRRIAISNMMSRLQSRFGALSKP